MAAGLATSGIAAIELGAVAGGGAGLGGGDLIGLVQPNLTLTLAT